MAKQRLAGLLLVFILLVPGLVWAVTAEDFEVETTQDLLNLCTTPSSDPLYVAATHFCYGYLVGAYDYYDAVSSGPKGIKLICLPDPPPSRNEAVSLFIKWLKVHPEYMSEPAVETEFRFLMEKWPCK